MKEVRKKAKETLKANKSVLMPKFVKDEEGNYTSAGQREVGTLKELREYFKEYKEIADIIRANYSRQIGKIYYTSLEELVEAPEYDFSDEQKTGPVPSLKSGFSDDEYDLRYSIGRGIARRSLDRILASDSMSVKRFKPGSEIIQLMQARDDKGLVVLPRMTELGVVAFPNKEANSIGIRFDKFKPEDAEVIKNYLLSVADSIEDKETATLCKGKIENLFDTAFELSQTEQAYTAGEKSLLCRLAQQAVDLMGVDLSEYHKKPGHAKVDTTEVFLDDDGAFAETEEGVPETAQDEQKLRTIVLEGLNKSEMELSDEGKVYTLISPKDASAYYVVEVDGEKILVSQTTPKESGKE